jgi:hypothetical protein
MIILSILLVNGHRQQVPMASGQQTHSTQPFPLEESWMTTDPKEQLRSGKPADEIEDQSKPVDEKDPAKGESKAQGTGGGQHKTGVAGRTPVGKGR